LVTLQLSITAIDFLDLADDASYGFDIVAPSVPETHTIRSGVPVEHESNALDSTSGALDTIGQQTHVTENAMPVEAAGDAGDAEAIVNNHEPPIPHEAHPIDNAADTEPPKKLFLVRRRIFVTYGEFSALLSGRLLINTSLNEACIVLILAIIAARTPALVATKGTAESHPAHYRHPMLDVHAGFHASINDIGAVVSANYYLRF
jgi:hypothetical protein